MSEGGIKGQATDIKIHAEWMLKTKAKLIDLYSKMTGQPVEKLEMDMERDKYMSAEEAKEYGLIAAIMIKR